MLRVRSCLFLLLLLPFSPSAWGGADFRVDVKDFGAVGDGKHDDTKAIQSALDSASNKKTVILPQGTYRITSPLNIPSNTKMAGAGRNFGTGIYPAGAGAFRIDGTGKKGGWVFRIHISDMVIYGTNTDNGSSRPLIYVNRAYNLTLEDVLVHDHKGSGCALRIGNANDVTVNRTVVYGNNNREGFGICIDNNSTVKLFSPDVENFHDGIFVNSGANVDIFSPYIERCIVGLNLHSGNSGSSKGSVNVFGGSISVANTSCHAVDVEGDNINLYSPNISLSPTNGGYGIVNKGSPGKNVNVWGLGDVDNTGNRHMIHDVSGKTIRLK